MRHPGLFRSAALVQALAETFHMEGRQLKIGASIGVDFVSPAKNIGRTINTDMLLHQADTALYRAKHEGRRTHCFFNARATHEGADGSAEKDQIAMLLRTAVEASVPERPSVI